MDHFLALALYTSAPSPNLCIHQMPYCQWLASEALPWDVLKPSKDSQLCCVYIPQQIMVCVTWQP